MCSSGCQTYSLTHHSFCRCRDGCWTCAFGPCPGWGGRFETWCYWYLLQSTICMYPVILSLSIRKKNLAQLTEIISSVVTDTLWRRWLSSANIRNPAADNRNWSFTLYRGCRVDKHSTGVQYHSVFITSLVLAEMPLAGSGVVRMDLLRFLAGCRTRRLNQV